MFNSAAVSVASTATVIYTFTAENQSIQVLNNEASVGVFLGGSGVTTGTGFKLAAGATVPVSGTAGEKLYGVVASSTGDVRVLKQGV